MAVQFNLMLLLVVTADICRCFQKKKWKGKKRKEREGSVIGHREHWGWGWVGGIRFNMRVAQGPGEGSLVTAVARSKGGRERRRQAAYWDEMEFKGLEVGRKGGACERQRLWRLEHMRHLGWGGWLVGVFLVDGRGLVQ